MATTRVNMASDLNELATTLQKAPPCSNGLMALFDRLHTNHQDETYVHKHAKETRNKPPPPPNKQRGQYPHDFQAGSHTSANPTSFIARCNQRLYMARKSPPAQNPTLPLTGDGTIERVISDPQERPRMSPNITLHVWRNLTRHNPACLAEFHPT